MTGTPLLDVAALRVDYMTARGMVRAVDDIDLAVGHEKVGLLGQSGSGKSTIGRALMGLLPESAQVGAQRVTLEGVPLPIGSAAAMRRHRGRDIAMILQDPHHALNPVTRVGAQIVEALRVGVGGMSRGDARRRGLDMLATVQMADPEGTWRAYPHELSGGMAQRVMLAMMLAPGPRLLVADEPTSALDVLARQAVLEVLDAQIAARHMGLLFISHDLTLLASFCDRVLVLRAGQIVERLPAAELESARADYTRALLAARPALEKRWRAGRGQISV